MSCDEYFLYLFKTTLNLLNISYEEILIEFASLNARNVMLG